MGKRMLAKKGSFTFGDNIDESLEHTQTHAHTHGQNARASEDRTIARPSMGITGRMNVSSRG